MSESKPKSDPEENRESPDEMSQPEEDLRSEPENEDTPLDEVETVASDGDPPDRENDPADNASEIEDAEILDTVPDHPDTARAEETEDAVETEVAPPPAPPPPPGPSSGKGFVTTLLGGVVAALIGAGAVYLLLPRTPPPVMPEPVDTARLEAIENALLDLKNTPPPEPAPAPEIDLTELDAVSDRLGQLETVLGGLDTRITTLSEEGITVFTGENEGEINAELTRLRAALDDLRAENSRLQATIAERETDIETVRAEAAARIAAAQAAAAEEIAAVKARVGDVEEAAKARASRAARGKALADLVAAVETGAPFDAVLPVLREEGAEIPENLAPLASTGVAKLIDLQDSFPDAARDGLAASIKATMGDSAGERLTAFIRSQVGARSLDARAGGDPDAVLSRAEAALRAGDIPDTLLELDALPPEGQAAMRDWIDRARGRQAALDAISALQTALTES